MSEQEEWRAVEGWPYEVSDRGRVRRSEPGSNVTFPGKVLAQHKYGKGYLHVTLHMDGGRKTFPVHRLVARAFIGAPEDNQQINHKNGDKKDNRPKNLEWVSPGENMKHAYDTGMRDAARGESAGGAKLTADEVREIRERFGEETNKTALGRKYGVTRQTIGKIIRRETWTHV